MVLTNLTKTRKLIKQEKQKNAVMDSNERGLNGKIESDNHIFYGRTIKEQ